jgi:GH35 family endo-1,4-beta-xylanase
MDNTILRLRNSNRPNFGVSINFQLIDLFEIAHSCNNNEEFVPLRDAYFKNLGADTRFQGFDYIFPGLEDITYDETLKIYNNLINDVDCITPEWSGKMRCTIDGRKPLFVGNEINKEIFNFEYLDRVASFARNHNLKLRMHNIIWHNDFIPFLKDASPDQIYHFLDVYMGELANRYSDVFYAIDVLNDIASDTPDKVLRDSEWKDKLGEDYYINVLRIAKKHFPNIDLYYNEYGEERPEKRQNIMEIVRRIQEIEKREGITLLDGIGIQSHYYMYTTDDSIKAAYSDLAKLGKKLQITELDVANDGEEQDFNYQTNRVFRTVLDCATSCGIELFNIWGISSNISWKKGKIDTYLDSNNNVSKYVKRIVETYSKKRKFTKEKMNDIDV